MLTAAQISESALPSSLICSSCGIAVKPFPKALLNHFLLHYKENPGQQLTGTANSFNLKQEAIGLFKLIKNVSMEVLYLPLFRWLSDLTEDRLDLFLFVIISICVQKVDKKGDKPSIVLPKGLEIGKISAKN